MKKPHKFIMSLKSTLKNITVHKVSVMNEPIGKFSGLQNIE